MASITITNTPIITAQTFSTSQIDSANPSVTYGVNFTGIPSIATGEILEFPNYSASVPEGPTTGQIWPIN